MVCVISISDPTAEARAKVLAKAYEVKALKTKVDVPEVTKPYEVDPEVWAASRCWHRSNLA